MAIARVRCTTVIEFDTGMAVNIHTEGRPKAETKLRLEGLADYTAAMLRRELGKLGDETAAVNDRLTIMADEVRIAKAAVTAVMARETEDRPAPEQATLEAVDGGGNRPQPKPAKRIRRRT